MTKIAEPNSEPPEFIPESSGVVRTSSCAPAGAAAYSHLLACMCRVPTEEGRETAIRFLVDSISEIFPHVALCVRQSISPNGSTLVATREPRPLFERSEPPRIFSQLRYERVFTLLHGGGWCLHCASDDHDILDDQSPAARLILPIVEMIDSTLKTAECIESLRARAADVREMQTRLVQTEKLASLGEVAAGVAHQISNPLTSILNYSDYLLHKAESLRTDLGDIERLRRMQDAANRIHKFARALTTYARPPEETPEPVSIKDVIERALVFSEHVIRESRASVQLDLTENLPPVLGVPGELVQVFVNLITNACQAMRTSGDTITVRAHSEQSAQYLVITVEDNGPGIRGEHLLRVFEPFFTTKDHDVGTGLGLSVVRFIVTSHHGEITAHSSPGNGAVFRIVLPAA